MVEKVVEGAVSHLRYCLASALDPEHSNGRHKVRWPYASTVSFRIDLSRGEDSLAINVRVDSLQLR